jgi:hypothetical protein
MFLFTQWRFWLAIGMLALVPILYMKGRSDGKRVVHLEWQAATAAANSEARRLEQARQRRADEAGALASTREAGIRIAGSRVAGERDGLRDDLHAARRRGSESLDACRLHAATLDAVFGQCAQRLEEVARDAAGHASDSLKLQQSWPTQ